MWKTLWITESDCQLISVQSQPDAGRLQLVESAADRTEDVGGFPGGYSSAAVLQTGQDDSIQLAGLDGAVDVGRHERQTMLGGVVDDVQLRPPTGEAADRAQRLLIRRQAEHDYTDSES